jgi:LCP family protein required for cell wall assembly
MTDGGRQPASAQRRLMAQIAAGRRARQRRIFLALLSSLSALVLLSSGGAWVVTSYVTGRVQRLNAGTSGTPSSGPLNILVAGVDIRAGLTRRQQLRLHVGQAISDNSDTLMLVHIPADHSYVQVVSLPRDSWVSIPGHGMNKINAAFGLGGPRLMVRTVEAATGLTIDDYAEVNFLGFVRLINALGGVSICLPFAVDDADSGLHLSAGRHHVGGITALEFARDRHSFAASDLARIDDQQQLMSTLLSQSASAGTLSNPFRLHAVVDAVTAAVRVDQGFNLAELADELRGIRPSQVAFSTVPVASLSYLTPAGQLAVTWNSAAAARLFTQIKNDQPPALLAPRHARRKAHSRQGARPGAAQHKAAQHKAAQRKAAKRRAATQDAAARRGGISGAAGAAAAQGTAPGQERTAAQDTCH